MNRYSTKQIIALIIVTVTLVLAAQVYRTIINYQVNRQRFANDVQLALDLSIEKYYAEKARSNIMVMSVIEGDTLAVKSIDRFSRNLKAGLDSTFQITTKHSTDTSGSFTFISTNLSGVINQQSFQSDTIIMGTGSEASPLLDSFLRSRSQESSMKNLTSKVLISLSEDLLELGKLWKLVSQELERKKINIDFQLEHDGVSGKTSMGDRDEAMNMQTTAKSTYLKRNERVDIYFENATLLILKRGLIDLLVSLAIVLSVIGALIYLYRIITKQKQVSLIKDDLIGNITHEFKTPIATISTAIEGISSFNEANDKEKTKRYLDISVDQLKKLNTMVEKLLETATIDSGNIKINTEETDLYALTQRVITNHQMLLSDKSVDIIIPEGTLWFSVDPFHMENALSNLVDNAIKYGGDQIKILIENQEGSPVWKVVDNGGAIDKEHQDRIFEKLYRIPKGNQHDVKGFGIGLYYTREVVDNHQGKITLEVKKNYTCFTIKL